MEKITKQKLTELLIDSGSYDDFLRKLTENARVIFPVQCTGKIKYKLAFDIWRLRIRVLCEIEVKCDSDDRNSSIVSANIISLDEYIHLCTKGNKKFHAAYENMVDLIRQKAG